MNLYIYIFIMAAVSYAIRALPLTLIRRQIKNQFIQSFLYYVPYVTLAVMTFPAIVEATDSPAAGLLALAVGIVAATDSPAAGLLALAVGIVAAWFGAGLFPVAVSCCLVVLIVEAVL